MSNICDKDAQGICTDGTELISRSVTSELQLKSNLPEMGLELNASGMLTRIISEVITNLQCPVCMQLCEPPLMSCTNGHFTCQSCIAKLTGDTLKRKPCPQCRESGFYRNLPYEKMALEFLADTDIKCPYNTDDIDGCNMSYKFGSLQKHLKTCTGITQKFNCPCIKCTESNLYSLPELIEHVLINQGFDTDEIYRLNFVSSLDIGKLDAMIGSILVKIENSGFGRNLGVRLVATETGCSYSNSPIINYELRSDAYTNYNYCSIYPPYDFFKNFKKEDRLWCDDLADNGENSTTSEPTDITNLTFLIDTSQIYLIRTTASYRSSMIFCDGTYLNSQFMDIDNQRHIIGLMINYNYNHKFSIDEEVTNTETGQPEPKRSRHFTFNKLKFLNKYYFEFEKYKSEMSEEVVGGMHVDIKGLDITKRDALGLIQWRLVF